MTEQKTFYLCDRRKCENCNAECNHTIDINHAVNFKKEGCDFKEIEKVMIAKIKRNKKYKKTMKILQENVEFRCEVIEE